MMAFIQVASPLGIVMGFALTKGIVMGLGGSSWKISFVIQAVMLLILGVTFFFIDKNYFSSNLFLVNKFPIKVSKEEDKRQSINIGQEEDKIEMKNIKEIVEDEQKVDEKDKNSQVVKEIPYKIIDAIELGKKEEIVLEGDPNEESFFQESTKPSRDFLSDAKTLLTERLYMLTTLAVTTLLFISTAIVFWTSDYLEKVLLVPAEKILIVFIITCITAPSLGIVIGGCIVQKLGGYQSKHSILVCFIFALLAWVLAIPIYFVDFTGFAFCLWLILFFRRKYNS
jgi:hypothetical protein